ncbi:MAG: DUF3793 family protein [Ruminococcus sp.]|uniref:Cell surface protein n=1 Tax=Ruminococcus albus SY3 TaxID=1341156 RepID=A0A011UWH1_RUMAL|nr:DUF3793 family protein [Ruminococcus albus]EXM37512.1 hypothetical protein RASY3_13095 [Ruminococcus albus SY3]MBP5268556.1 DUF3793 family protein [Ruminococcus sp.]
MLVEEIKRLENVLAFHAAPTLMGMKCGSLPTLSSEEYNIDELSRLFAKRYFGTRIGARIISRCSHRTIIYLYDMRLLEATLSDKAVRNFLAEYGYDKSWDAQSCLDRLCKRLTQSDFPHEIGIFLGYPLEDVKGFIANCGQKCKLCGVWKVYGDVERAKAMFECYKQCRIHLCKELKKGKQLRSCVA